MSYFEPPRTNSRNTGMTLEEVAELLGCTRERVRQIEARAFMKIRRRLKLRGINADDILGTMIDSTSEKSAGGVRHES
jgi:predicted transcriptional regulator